MLEFKGKIGKMMILDCDDELVVVKEDVKEAGGYEFYYKLYSNGLCEYGCYDLNDNRKWWSSRAEVINEVFGLKLYPNDVIVNSRAYGILAEVREVI